MGTREQEQEGARRGTVPRREKLQSNGTDVPLELPENKRASGSVYGTPAKRTPFWSNRRQRRERYERKLQDRAFPGGELPE